MSWRRSTGWVDRIGCEGLGMRALACAPGMPQLPAIQVEGVESHRMKPQAVRISLMTGPRQAWVPTFVGLLPTAGRVAAFAASAIGLGAARFSVDVVNPTRSRQAGTSRLVGRSHGRLERMSGRHTRVTLPYGCQYDGTRAPRFGLPHLPDTVCTGARGEASLCSTRTGRSQQLLES